MNSDFLFFKKGNKICIVSPDYDETLEEFAERGYFITSQKPKNLDEYNKAEYYSRIFINVKNKKCEYEPIIHKQLQNMLLTYLEYY